jgi:hypothetical protein
VDNSDRHDFLLLLAYQPHQPGGLPTWNDVLSSSWWNRSMCGSLLMQLQHIEYADFDNGTNGRIILVAWHLMQFESSNELYCVFLP